MDGAYPADKSCMAREEIDSFDDHRIAMAFAVAALRAEGESTILHPACVAISYPSFFYDLESLIER